jgi:hypothetical protein
MYNLPLVSRDCPVFQYILHPRVRYIAFLSSSFYIPKIAITDHNTHCYFIYTDVQFKFSNSELQASLIYKKYIQYNTIYTKVCVL